MGTPKPPELSIIQYIGIGDNAYLGKSVVASARSVFFESEAVKQNQYSKQGRSIYLGLVIQRCSKRLSATSLSIITCKRAALPRIAGDFKDKAQPSFLIKFK